jgi:hypothetical protein
MAKELTSKAPVVRPRRTPLAVRSKLTVKDVDPNYHYRIVNVVEDRVELLQEQGYEIVPDAKVGDNRVDKPSTLGSATEVSVGQGMKAVVMRIPKEWYKEDQTIKQQQIDALESSMNADAARGK